MTQHKRRVTVWGILLPIGFVFLGIVIMVALVKTKPQAAKKQRLDIGQLVKAETVQAANQRVKIRAFGKVMPSRSVILSPEVAGRVVSKSPRLAPGAIFRTNEEIVRLDARDYRAALAQSQATYKQAQAARKVEQGAKAVADAEIEALGDPSLKVTPLARREPQGESARQAERAARSAQELAWRNVERTILRAPFNAVVRSHQVDIGQVVAPGAAVVTLAGTDTFWVRISVPYERLAWLRIPGVNGVAEGGGSRARIWREVQPAKPGRPAVNVERQGSILRMLPDFHPTGLMAQLLVEIKDPLALNPQTRGAARGSNLWLLVDSLVQVELQGERIPGAVAVPRVAVRDGNSVFVARAERSLLPPEVGDTLFWAPQELHDELRTVYRLDIRTGLTIEYKDRERVFIAAGDKLRSGDMIVTTPIGAPVQNMKLRFADGDDARPVIVQTPDEPPKPAESGAPSKAKSPGVRVPPSGAPPSSGVPQPQPNILPSGIKKRRPRLPTGGAQ